jgi:predicted nuclease of predicted toxin-antitoxin system
MRLLADENFNGAIVRGLQRSLPGLDIVRVQDVGLSGADDPTILEWAAGQGRLLLTHDGSAVPSHSYQRVVDGKPMPGVVVVRESLPIGRAIDDLLLFIECSLEGEWRGRCDTCPSDNSLLPHLAAPP